MVNDNANTDDIIAYLSDKNIPADDITLNKLAEQILQTPPEQGYLTISRWGDLYVLPVTNTQRRYYLEDYLSSKLFMAN